MRSSGAVRLLVLGVLFALLAGCGEDEPATPVSRAQYDESGHLIQPHRLPSRPPNLVLIVVDTLRADALGGEGPPRMPFLEELASEAVRFEDAVAPSPWTLPSMTSLFTALRPSTHGMTDERREANLSPSVVTAAEILANGYGYETAAFEGGAWFLRPGAGIYQGFQHHVTNFTLEGTQAAVGSWNRARRDPDKPFFLLLHTYQAHDPYGAKNHRWPQGPAQPILEGLPDLRDTQGLVRAFFLDRDLRDGLMSAYGMDYMDEVLQYVVRKPPDVDESELIRDIREAYWEGARWTDDTLRKAMGEIEEMGLLENSLVVVTADHGEAFREHGLLGHRRQLYDELVHIPLVMKGPAPFDEPRRIDGTVGLIDLLPTYFDLVGIPPLLNQDVEGRSFLETVRGAESGRPILSEERFLGMGLGLGHRDEGFSISVRSPQYKYIVTYNHGAGTVLEELYDLGADPGETVDLAAATGRVPSLSFDEAFCAEIEHVRDLIWTNVTDRQNRVNTPYGAGLARVTGERPAPCSSRE